MLLRTAPQPVCTTMSSGLTFRPCVSKDNISSRRMQETDKATDKTTSDALKCAPLSNSTAPRNLRGPGGKGAFLIPVKGTGNH